MISFHVNDDLILYIKLTDQVNFGDIKNFLLEFQSIEKLPNELKLLYDLHNAELKLEAEEIKDISNLAEEATQKYTSVRTAFLVSKPHITAYSILFANFASNNKTKRNIFSTEEAAIDWLMEN